MPRLCEGVAAGAQHRIAVGVLRDRDQRRIGGNDRPLQLGRRRFAVENQRLQSPIVIRIQHRGAFFAAHSADDAIEFLAERGDVMLRRITQSEANELGH